MHPTDLALVLGATARLSRLVVVDEIGQWWIKDPIDSAMEAYGDREIAAAEREGREPRTPWWWKYRSGLDCPFCVGFWLGAGVLASERVTRGTPLRGPWRFAVGALTLNYVVAHTAARLGDVEDED